MSEAREWTVSFDGQCWHACDNEGNSLPLTRMEESWLPDLPEDTLVNTLILPVEKLLVRSFSLPLPHPRLIDAGVLAQELDERSGEEQGAWWLAWHAEKNSADAGGVAGMVFGMPELWRQAIASDARWQGVQHVLVDAWVHLQMYVDGWLADTEEHDPVAVFDADVDGVFFGVWQPTIAKDGYWRGMRRLNQDASDGGASDLAEQCLRSLVSMGWDVSRHAACGRLDEGTLQALQLADWQGDSIEETTALPTRYQVYVSGGCCTEVDFRHGRWAASSGWLRPWRRALTMAAGLLVIWMLGSMYQIYALGAQAETYRQQINTAFHQGLPNELVMIDALAQLRRAAGGGTTGDHSPALWLQQLAAINRVHQKTPWDMQELEWRDGGVALAGVAANLESLNRIREALQRESGRDVQLVDTDLSGDKVSFRMHWQ